MRRKKYSAESNDKSATKTRRTVVLNSGRPLVPSAKFASFPASISHLVGEYLPIDERSCVETAFAGVQPITLCLSQDVGSEPASCWSLGFLPPNCQWKPSDAKIDKEYPIQDYERCLRLLEQEDSNYCQMTIATLVVKLSKTSNDLPLALKDLRKTIKELWRHLSSVKHVVISIADYASCSFTLNDDIRMVNEMRPSVDKSKALFEIIDDLDICGINYPMLDAHNLFTFYFKHEAKPASEVYLAKLVIPLNSKLNRKLFDDEATKTLSAKIMWVCYIKSLDDLSRITQDTTRMCHAILFDMSGMENYQLEQLSDRVRDVLFFQDNRFIERIVLNSVDHSLAMQLLRPRVPLTVATPRFALIELTLEGLSINLDLTLLNDGHFPHLAHLCIMDGEMSGHLDSQSVPSLKTLRLNPRDESSPGRLIHERLQASVDARRPWQLVASRDQRGWSLASYDDPTTNPHDEQKDGAPQSPPIIRELMLVMQTQTDVDEFQSRLDVNLSPEAAINHQKDGLLVWAPDRVEKITAFCTSWKTPRLEFTKKIPGQTRILTSLMCHDVDIKIGDDVLPHLQSLELNFSRVTLSGAFPHLRTLSLLYSKILSPWEVNAPLLESFSCQKLIHGNKLSLRPLLLPHLSYLRIELYRDHPQESPAILFNENHLGLLPNLHVVFCREMISSPCFDQCQVHHVSQLELTVDPLKLPACWDNTVWQCETLTIDVHARNLKFLHQKGITVIKMPPLLPRVKTLTVTSKEFPVLLDSEMPELTDCTVVSTRMLGPNLRCPALGRICFTGELSDIEKEQCFDRAMYIRLGAQPRWVFFGDGSNAKRMSWDVAPNKTEVLLPLDELLEEVD